LFYQYINVPFTHVIFFSQDFRLHLSRATEKAGRPVIPSEVLNRILKFLPQLQNFNEDLLRDLEDRVANWYVEAVIYHGTSVTF